MDIEMNGTQIDGMSAEFIPYIANDTPMNKETLRVFYKPVKRSAVIFAVLFIVFLAAGILSLTIFDEAFLGGIFLVCSLCIGCCTIAVTVITWKNINNNSMFSPSLRCLYEFGDCGFRQITYTENGVTGSQFIAYGQLNGVTVRKQIILLTIANLNYILLRSCFTKGSEGDLIALMRSKNVPLHIKDAGCCI